MDGCNPWYTRHMAIQGVSVTAIHTDRVLAYQRRVRAMEMFAGGMNKSAIARALGVARQNVVRWAQRDHWDERLGQPATPTRVMSSGELEQASKDGDELARAVTGNLVAATLVKLRTKLGARVVELEALCGPTSSPTVRLRAIEVWLKLAGVRQIMPDPSVPAEAMTQRDLQLLDDLASTELRGVERIQQDVGLHSEPDSVDPSLHRLSGDDHGDSRTDAEGPATAGPNDVSVAQPVSKHVPLPSSIDFSDGNFPAGPRIETGVGDQPSDDDEFHGRVHGGIAPSDLPDGPTGHVSAWGIYDR